MGQSEENMRDLFAPAEKEFKGKGDKSQLHVIIFDEIDAIMVGLGRVPVPEFQSQSPWIDD